MESNEHGQELRCEPLENKNSWWAEYAVAMVKAMEEGNPVRAVGLFKGAIFTAQDLGREKGISEAFEIVKKAQRQSVSMCGCLDSPSDELEDLLNESK